MAVIHTLFKLIYSVGVILIVFLAYMSWVVFGSYANGSIENLVRQVRYQEAGDGVANLVGIWADKAYSFLDLLSWSIFFVTLIAVVSLICNWCFLAKWRDAQAEIEALKDIDRDS